MDKTDHTNGSDGISIRLKIMAVLAPVLASLAVNMVYGPFVIDDTYIGLRYIENMARGQGLMFNPGEAVLGISCPLYCLLLALVRWVGFNLVDADIALGTGGVAVMIALVVLIALRRVGPATAGALGLFIALFPVTPFTANSGMETGMSLALIYLTFAALFTGRYALAGLISGLEVQVRPDAAILALVAGAYILIKDRNKLLRFIAPFAIVNIPWTVYSTVIYGSPIPHSIVAKRANHAIPALAIVKQIATLALALLPVSVFAAAGIVRAARERSEHLVIAAWVALYAAGLVFAGIDPIQFIWYFSPLLPAWALLAAFGLDGTGRALLARAPAGSRRRRLAAGAPAAVLVFLSLAFGAGTFPLRTYLKNTGYERVDRYLEIGAWITQQARPGDVVMVAECGALSYAMMDQYIFDQSGLNNPEVYDLCRIGPGPAPGEPPDPRPRFLTAECELALIKSRQPDYIMTFTSFMHVGELSQDPWFRRHYQRIPFGGPAMNDYIILQKIAPSSP